MYVEDRILDFDGFQIVNFSTCWCVTNIYEETILRDDYQIGRIDFQPDDIVIDVGANVGIVSIWIARQHPDIKVYAFEPCFRNFKHFQKNIELNNIQNVEAIHSAVTADGRDVKISLDIYNTGAPSIYKTRVGDKFFNECKSVNLDQFLEERGIKRVKFLKLDCEGAEYEILYSFKGWDKVEYLSLEVHGIRNNGREFFERDKLIKFIKRKMPADRLVVHILD